MKKLLLAITMIILGTTFLFSENYVKHKLCEFTLMRIDNCASFPNREKNPCSYKAGTLIEKMGKNTNPAIAKYLIKTSVLCYRMCMDPDVWWKYKRKQVVNACNKYLKNKE